MLLRLKILGWYPLEAGNLGRGPILPTFYNRTCMSVARLCYDRVDLAVAP